MIKKQESGENCMKTRDEEKKIEKECKLSE